MVCMCALVGLMPVRMGRVLHKECYNDILQLRACLETHLSIMKRFNSMLAMAI